MNKKMEQKMTKIDEIIEKYNVHHGTPDDLGYGCFYDSDMENAMKEYAEWYAQKCLEVAIEKVQVNHLSDESPNCKLIVKAINRMQLPEHK